MLLRRQHFLFSYLLSTQLSRVLVRPGFWTHDLLHWWTVVVCALNECGKVTQQTYSYFNQDQLNQIVQVLSFSIKLAPCSARRLGSLSRRDEDFSGKIASWKTWYSKSTAHESTSAFQVCVLYQRDAHLLPSITFCLSAFVCSVTWLAM